MQENKPLLIVGLGNPGREYENNRHNVGFMALDILTKESTNVWKKEKNALTLHEIIHGQKIIFAKPQTFMNNSGEAVLALMTFYKIPISNLIVIHDDMDLPVGVKREKVGGSSAGHNGIKSIDAHVGQEYKRIRIGIGHPKDYNLQTDVVDWVLGNPTKEQVESILNILSTITL